MNNNNPSSNKNNMSVASSSGVMKPIGKSILRALSMELAQAEEEVNDDNDGDDRCHHPGCDHGGAMPLSLLLQQHHEHLSDQDLEALLLSQQQDEEDDGGGATAAASTATTGGDVEGDHMVDEGEESFRLLRNETSRLSQCQHQHRRYNHPHSHEQPPPANNNNNMNPAKPATSTIHSSLLMSDLRKLALSRKYLQQQQQQQQNSPPKRSMTLSVSELRRLSEAYEYVPNKHRNKCYATLLGLTIAVIATSTNATSFTLSYHYNVKTPLFQLFWMYAMLSFHLLFRDEIIINTGGAEESDINNLNDDSESHPKSPNSSYYKVPFTKILVRIPWSIYLLCGVLDVLPNFLTLLSFQYTSLTSTTLLGSLAVPTSMIFSKLILNRVFCNQQYVGVILCVLGGALIVLSDANKDNNDDDSITANSAASITTTASATATSTVADNPHSYFGDLMAVGAAVFYSLGETIAEYSIKHADRYEYLGMLGFNGMLITGFLFPIFERDEILDLFQNENDPVGLWTVFVLYVCAVLVFYMSVAYFLVASDVTLLVLSLQTSNVWAVLFSVVAYSIVPSTLFYFSALLVVSGVIIYQYSQKQQQHEGDHEAMYWEMRKSIVAIANSTRSCSNERRRRKQDYVDI